MPELQERFHSEQSADTVWRFFQNVEKVVECMPGVDLTETLADGTYKGKLRVKMGLIASEFQGEARITEADPITRTVRFEAKGVDRRGGTRASASISYRLIPTGSGTDVELGADLRLQGNLAQFGRTGLLEEISRRLTQEFAECLSARVEGSSPAASSEIRILRLFSASVVSWFRKLLRGRR